MTNSESARIVNCTQLQCCCVEPNGDICKSIFVLPDMHNVVLKLQNFYYREMVFRFCCVNSTFDWMLSHLRDNLTRV